MASKNELSAIFCYNLAEKSYILDKTSQTFPKHTFVTRFLRDFDIVLGRIVEKRSEISRTKQDKKWQENVANNFILFSF